MHISGKVFLTLTILLLLWTFAPIPSPWGGWAPTLLVIQNEWALKLRDAKAKNLKDVEAHNNAKIELQEAKAELARLQLGWDRVWEFRNGEGNTSITLRPPYDLIVNGIGHQIGHSDQSPNNFVTRQITDATGNTQLVPPVVHVFRAIAPEQFTYVGEFIADASNLNQASTILLPTRIPTAQEPQPWQNGNGIWRLRTSIPPAPRSSMDEIHRRMTRTQELLAETSANLAQQQALLQAAQAQLDVRKGELLGDPAAKKIPGRPEFSEGLLKTIEDEEEQRNQIQLEIDSLRRGIKNAAEQRDALRDELNQLIQQLPSSADSGAKLTERRSELAPQ
jgi:hypothetical protein